MGTLALHMGSPFGSDFRSYRFPDPRPRSDKASPSSHGHQRYPSGGFGAGAGSPSTTGETVVNGERPVKYSLPPISSIFDIPPPVPANHHSTSPPVQRQLLDESSCNVPRPKTHAEVSDEQPASSRKRTRATMSPPPPPPQIPPISDSRLVSGSRDEYEEERPAKRRILRADSPSSIGSMPTPLSPQRSLHHAECAYTRGAPPPRLAAPSWSPAHTFNNMLHQGPSHPQSRHPTLPSISTLPPAMPTASREEAGSSLPRSASGETRDTMRPPKYQRWPSASSIVTTASAPPAPLNSSSSSSNPPSAQSLSVSTATPTTPLHHPASAPVSATSPSGANPGSPGVGATTPNGASTSSERYPCPICSKAFSRPSSLRIHSHSHTGEKPFRCPHKGCGKAFSVRSNMKRHERGCHVERRYEVDPAMTFDVPAALGLGRELLPARV